MKTPTHYLPPTIETLDAKTVVESLGPAQGYGPPEWAHPGGVTSPPAHGGNPHH